MPGITAIIADDPKLRTHEPTGMLLGEASSDRADLPDGVVHRRSTTKFAADKLFAEGPSSFIALDGFVSNWPQLGADAHDFSGRLVALDTTLSGEKPHLGLRRIRGEFSGVRRDRATGEWLVFTNQNGSKPVYYWHEGTTLLCSGDLASLSDLLRTSGRTLSLNETAAMFLLTYGFILGDHTLIDGVQKLPPGHCLRYRDGQLNIERYHRFAENAGPAPNDSDECIEELDRLFRQAVHREYDKDREEGLRHAVTLSGGLDSRMTFMVAAEEGFDDLVAVTCSQGGYQDEQIARRIAADLRAEFICYSLDEGNYLLRELQDSVRANGGLVLYSGAAHLLGLLKRVDFRDLGMLHMGQLGDAVLGSYLKKPRNIAPQPLTKAYAPDLLDAVRDAAQMAAEPFESNELFLLYNRGFNGVHNGTWLAHQFTECSSAFLDVDFLEFALRIPPELRFGESLYQKWIRRRVPAATRYVWERTKAKPGANPLAIRFRQAVWLAGMAARGKLLQLSMNPFRSWYRTNPRLGEFMRQRWRAERDRLDAYPLVRRSAEQLMDYREQFSLRQAGALTRMTQVITLLEAMQLHLG
jgi:asparagine synthase (glutamine-hydrolysing)